MKPILLIVEADADLCDVYSRFLTRHGYEVATASDGLDCLGKLRRGAPAAVVLDRELHWGGGDGVLAWMREQEAMSGVPVILTATAEHALDDAKDLRPPVVAFLPKPFSLMALLQRVRVLMAPKEHEGPFNRDPAACSEFYLG